MVMAMEQQVPPQAVPFPIANASLYVGDLDASITEADLADMFNCVGPVVSVRVCRVQLTRASLGYGYVNYSNPDHAVQAIGLLNNTNLKGKEIRVMFSQRDPSIRRSGAANIFIKNLEKSINNRLLYETFSRFGSIISCKVATDHHNQSKGYGFVQFENEDAAKEAINSLNGTLLNEKKVYVGPFLRQEERKLRNGTTLKFTNVYVKNLSDKIREDDLKNAFSVHGSITSVVIMRDEEGKSKGFGFVNFENSDDAIKAVEYLNGKKVKENEKEWYVGKAQKKAEREAELKAKFEQDRKDRLERLRLSNLYLKNIDDSFDDQKLREVFEEFGTVTSCKVMQDDQGQSKGTGFITFSTPVEAMHAISEMNGKVVGHKPLYVAFAQPKAERRAMMEAQFSNKGATAAYNLTMPGSVAPYHHSSPQFSHQPGVFAQGPHAFVPQQHAGFGYQHQMLPLIRPNVSQLPNHNFPQPFVRPIQTQRTGGRSGVMPQFQQQTIQRNSNKGIHHPSNVQNGTYYPSIQITSEARLASPSAEEQRMMLGEPLYPLVEKLVGSTHAGKVTGMLLEMDKVDVLHHLNSPNALQEKVEEALRVLQVSQNGNSVGETADHLASMSVNA